MATVTKDFKVKYGLVVEGSTATVAGNTILTEVDGDAYILDLIGGETLVTSVEATQMEVIAGELNIKSGVFDSFGSAVAAQAAAEDYTDTRETAITTAYQSYADQAESDAVSSANFYTDGRETAITTAYQTYADQAETDAKAYTDTRETAITTAYQSYADQAETDAVSSANSYTDTALEYYTTTANLDTTVSGYGYLKNADLNGYATESYVGTAIDNLVDGAPGLLDTLNEIAAAINDDENYSTTITTALGTKAPLASPDLTGVPTAPTASANTNTTQIATTAFAKTEADAAETAANSYTDGRETAITTAYQSYADTAQTDAETFATNAINALDTDDIEEGSTNLYFTNQRAIDAVGGTIEDQINLLSTDDIEEGSTNLYFTTTRAKDDAAALLTSATLTNITITGSGTGLTITAENGVADSDTDDLTEGSTNLYFTDVRAVDALEAVVPNFTEIDINSIATQVAATTGLVVTASTVTAYAFPHADYRSAKFLVKTAYGSHTEISEVILTLDTSENVAITEYAIVGTNGSAMTVSADVVGTDVRLRVTTTNNNSTVNVVGTLLA